MPEHTRDGDEAHESKRAARAVRDQATAKRVYGEPVELDGVTIIPVAAVRRCGRQEGAGESKKECGCSFISARPVGLVVIRDGQVEWKPTLDVNRVVLAVAGVLGLLVFLRRRR
jgi:uncharacterized spore protein YtfJ